jgi:uncharacterized membrane protein YbhN (UPF0104 family)
MKTFLKMAFAFGIIYWLVANGKLDPKLMVEVLKYPELLITAAILLIVQISLCAYRWSLMLKIKSPEIPFEKVYRLQWIGQLFSAILPGGVTGDLIKIGHLAHDYKNISKTYLLFTIFLDRVIGLCALLCVSSVTGLIFFQELVELNSIFKEIILLNTLLFLGSLGFLSLFFLNTPQKNFILSIVKLEKLKKYLLSLWAIGQHRKKFLEMFGVSLIAHLCGIGAFIVINKNFLAPHVDFRLLFSVIPIGQTSAALPISPGGLGVGHIVFDRLFSFIHQAQGASLFNLSWMMIFCTNLLGLIPYLFSKKQKT